VALLNLLLTNAGAAALAQATQVGPVVIAEVAIGSSSWSPTAGATALQNEIKRITAIDGGASNGVIHMTLTDDSSDAYQVREIGLYTDSDVLFAILSAPSVIFDKLTATTLFLAIDITLNSVAADAPITVTGATSFDLPAATDAQAGIVRRATSVEANAVAGAGVPTMNDVATAMRQWLPVQGGFIVSPSQSNYSGGLQSWSYTIDAALLGNGAMWFFNVQLNTSGAFDVSLFTPTFTGQQIKQLLRCNGTSQAQAFGFIGDRVTPYDWSASVSGITSSSTQGRLVIVPLAKDLP
jgi:hypothetical protein